jgi:hypothetical protein
MFRIAEAAFCRLGSPYSAIPSKALSSAENRLDPFAPPGYARLRFAKDRFNSE